MTTTITKQQCEDLINSLADKTLSFGCKVDVGWSEPHYVTVLRTLRSNTYKICNFRANLKYDGLQDIIEYQNNFTVDRTPLAEINKILGHDILIGDVLAALDEAKEEYGLRFAGEFLSLWRLCLDPKDANSITGLKRSLQAIFEDMEWESVECSCHNSGIAPCYMCENYGSKSQQSLVAKPSPATDLFEFLISLNLNAVQ